MCSKHQKLGEVTTTREMLSALAGQFDPLGILAPCLLEGKLILQKVTFLDLGWDDELPEDILKDWSKWVNVMESFAGLSITRYCFLEGPVIEDDGDVAYQLHGFCDASNQALSCVVFLRRIINGRSCVALVQGKAKVVLVNQTNWVMGHEKSQRGRRGSRKTNDTHQGTWHSAARRGSLWLSYARSLSGRQKSGISGDR